MKKKIAIIALGKPNSGKSTTWYTIFGRKIRTGWKKLKLNSIEKTIFVKNSSFEEMGKEIDIKIFVRNASFEEYGDNIESSKISNLKPNIVFCSVQYTKKGLKTIDWFKKNDYYLYIQWLNPGYKQKTIYSDNLNFEKQFSNYGEFHKVSGKETTERVKNILNFLNNVAK